MSKWSEIRNDFFDEIEKSVYIDAWETGDDNEEGKVIAIVYLDKEEVKYIDEDAKIDSYAQEMIKEVYERGAIYMTVNVNRDALCDYIQEKLKDRLGDEFENISDQAINKIMEFALDRHQLIDFQMEDETNGFNKDQALWAIEGYMVMSMNYFANLFIH